MLEDSKVVELQPLSPLYLHDYVSNGTTAELQTAILHNQISVDQRNDFQQTALHISCSLGKEDFASILIEYHANINSQDVEGITPLIAASKSGSMNCMRLLIQSGAEVHLTDNVGWTALMWACYKGHTDITKMLLNEGADVHVHVAYNMTCLLWAAGRGYDRIVRMLCEKGAKVNCADKFGSTPLMWACRRGFVNVVNILFEYKADADAVGANGANALISAAKSGHENCSKVILNQSKVNANHTDKDTNSALSYAAKLGNYETIVLLLNHGAYLNLADKNGDTPLIKAVKHGHHEAVRALLSRFADVDIRGKNDMTALHWGCELGHVGIVRELLACNSDTEAMTNEGETPLLRAVKNKNVTITRMLLDKGARVTAMDKKNDTPLHIAIRARSLRIVKLLLRNPRDGRLLYQPNKAGETPYNLDAAHNKGILANVFGAKNLSPESAMHEASGEGIQQSYDLYSSALADILCEPTLTPPLTVGLYAKWGSGKSFLLNKLQEQMKVFTSANQKEPLRKPHLAPFVIVFLISVFLGIFTASLTLNTEMRVLAGVIVFCSIFFLYSFIIALVSIGVSFGGWQWAIKVGSFLNSQYEYLSLICQLWFMIPPSVKQTHDGKAIPVRFLFTNYSRLTSVGGETSLAEMIGLLSSLAEKNMGFLAVRLYRAFRINIHDESVSHATYRKICCIPTLFLTIFFLFGLGSVILLVTITYGPEPTILDQTVDGNSTDSYYISVMTASICVLASVNLLLIVIAFPTLVTICTTILWSQRSRVLSATHHSKSQEHLMQQLKKEVDLLCQTVIAIDSFTGVQTRMCVFINGLDSCEQDKVLQVLDTVHVLFSQRPYITILAIDPVIISKAIHNNLNSVFRDANISGYDYLKNIVQLPFYMKDKTQLSQRKLRSHADREDGLTDADSDLEELSVVIDTRRTSRSGSFPARSNRANGVRRGQKSIDLSRLMYSEDWFNSVSPYLMKRILNIVSLTGRLLRADGVDFSWGRLAAWINLTEQWPYRTSFLINALDKSDTTVAATTLLRTTFDENQSNLSTNDPMLAIDSSDDRSFRAFLSARFLTARDVRDFLPSTVNLDPKLRDFIAQEPYKHIQEPVPMPQPVMLMTTQQAFMPHSSSDGRIIQAQEPSHAPVQVPPPESATSSYSAVANPVTDWSVEEVCQHLCVIRGLMHNNLNKYADFVRANNVTGLVLISCDLDDLKKELFAPFGDWSLIKQWIIKLRTTYISDDRSENSVGSHNPAHVLPHSSFQGKVLTTNAGLLTSTGAPRQYSQDSLDFTLLQGSERVAYDLAFKEYLKLQPSTNDELNTDRGSSITQPSSNHSNNNEVLFSIGNGEELEKESRDDSNSEGQTFKSITTGEIMVRHVPLSNEDLLNGNSHVSMTCEDSNNNEGAPLLPLRNAVDDDINANA